MSTPPMPPPAERGRVPRRRATTLLGLVAALLMLGWSGAAPAHADAARDGQWQLTSLGAAAAWRHATGTGVTVAVLDSGVDATHPDLAGQVLPGADFVTGTGTGTDDQVGHGTTVAGLIAGRADDQTGVVGVAPGARILPVRVLDADNKYDDAKRVADGLRWAVDHGARVVNMSLGGTVRSEVLTAALRYAAERDVVVIACTGNLAPGAPTEVWYPAREAGVVAVTGLVGEGGVEATPVPQPSPSAVAGAGAGRPAGTAPGVADQLWSGSLTGPETTLSAPAVNLLGARPGGRYWRVQGTSFAAPLVAGTAALLRSRYPTLSAPNIINRMIRTARDIGPSGRDDRYGYGAVDPVAALAATVPEVRGNPLAATPAAAPARGDPAGTRPSPTATASPGGAKGPAPRAAGHRSVRGDAGEATAAAGQSDPVLGPLRRVAAAGSAHSGWIAAATIGGGLVLALLTGVVLRRRPRHARR